MANDIQFSIGANAKNFKVAIEQINKDVKTLQKSIMEKMSTIGFAFDGIVKTAKAISSVLSEPFKQFSRYEDAATRLAPLLGSLELAKELAGELRDEAANGTAPFEQLVQIAGQLASVFKDTSTIKKWTTAFHNLAAGTGLDVNELVSNFVKSKATGRFEFGFLDSFAQKGINLFPELEKQTGKTTEELRKLASEGKLAFSEIETAILAVSTGTGKFAGQAAALSNTFSGSIGTLKAEWDTLLAKLADPAVDFLTPKIQALSKALKENSDIVNGMPHATVIGAAGVAATIATAKISAFCATSGAGLAGVAAAAKSLGAALTSMSGIIGILTVGAAAGTWYFTNKLEGEAGKQQGLINATERLDQARQNLENANSLEELEKALKACDNAWKGYVSARERGCFSKFCWRN